MIEINLLPRQYRRKKKKKFEVNLPFAIGAILLLVFLALVTLETMVRSKKAEVASWSTKLENIKPQFQEARETVDEIRPLTLRLKRLSEMEEKRVLWARILNDLSDVFPEELQLKSLRDGGGYLVFAGVLSADEGDESVTRLIEVLKDKGRTCFPQYFATIKLEEIKKQTNERKFFKIKCKRGRGTANGT